MRNPQANKFLKLTEEAPTLLKYSPTHLSKQEQPPEHLLPQPLSISNGFRHDHARRKLIPNTDLETALEEGTGLNWERHDSPNREAPPIWIVSHTHAGIIAVLTPSLHKVGFHLGLPMNWGPKIEHICNIEGPISKGDMLFSTYPHEKVLKQRSPRIPSPFYGLKPLKRKQYQEGLLSLIEICKIGDRVVDTSAKWEDCDPSSWEGFAQRIDKSYQLMADRVKQLPNGAKVLDLGAGTGLVEEEVLKERPDIQFTATDMSEGMLAHLRRKPLLQSVATRVYQHGGSDHPFSGANFDAVICNGSFPYLHTLKGVAGTMAEVLKPGGLMVGSFVATDPSNLHYCTALVDGAIHHPFVDPRSPISTLHRGIHAQNPKLQAHGDGLLDLRAVKWWRRSRYRHDKRNISEILQTLGFEEINYHTEHVHVEFDTPISYTYVTARKK